MIQLTPTNFVWPQTNNQESQNIGWDDYQVSQIIEYLKDQMGIDNITIYSDQEQTHQLQEDATLTQQGLQQNCILYLVYQQFININLYLNGVNLNQMCEAQPDNTCQEIIEQLYQGTEVARIELKNSQNQLVAQDPFIQIQNLNNLDKNLHLYIYTQQQQQQQLPQQFNQLQNSQQQQQQPKNQLSNSFVSDPKQLLDQLVVLSKMSLLIDQNGYFVIFKFHQPLQINGILLAKNGKNRQINQSVYDFVKKNDVELAQADEEGYSLLVKWKNETYSSIKIRKQG